MDRFFGLDLLDDGAKKFLFKSFDSASTPFLVFLKLKIIISKCKKKTFLIFFMLIMFILKGETK